MDDRMLSAIVLVGLSGLFCSYGIFTLVAAYRTGNLADWGKLAIMGGAGVLLRAVMADVAFALLTAQPSGLCKDGQCGTQPSSYISPTLVGERPTSAETLAARRSMKPLPPADRQRTKRERAVREMEHHCSQVDGTSVYNITREKLGASTRTPLGTVV
jgi:hypothetical protein